MKIAIVLFLLLTTAGRGVAQDPAPREVLVVPSIDPLKYAGTWYEIARLPNRFEDDCIGDVTATYTVDGDEFIVVNRCRKENNEFVEAEGRARKAVQNGPNTKLKVRFAPAFLSFLPFVWGDYWIIDVAADYRYAVVGDPDRKYLWVLSRTKTLDEATLAGILERIRIQGYDPRALVMTPQQEQG